MEFRGFQIGWYINPESDVTDLGGRRGFEVTEDLTPYISKYATLLPLLFILFPPPPMEHMP